MLELEPGSVRRCVRAEMDIVEWFVCRSQLTWKYMLSYLSVSPFVWVCEETEDGVIFPFFCLLTGAALHAFLGL